MSKQEARLVARPHEAPSVWGSSATANTPRRLITRWAVHADEVKAAQRLRYEVFVHEMGARLVPSPCGPDLDVDRFDAHCEHLLVVAEDAGGAAQVVGTYRVLTPSAAQRAGGFYSESEFDLGPLAGLRSSMVELGRACVHPAWRNGAAVLALWSALAAFMHRNRLPVMIGCASLPMRDGGHHAASLWERLRGSHLAPSALQISPHLPLPVAELRRDLDAEPPALVRGYLRCGARLLGPPAWDPAFNTADLPMMMRVEDLPERYRRATTEDPRATMTARAVLEAPVLP